MPRMNRSFTLSRALRPIAQFAAWSRFVALLVGVFIGTGLFSQTFYNQYGNNLVNEGGQCVIASSDGNMFVGGYKDDSALVLKVDMSGNILWSRVFKPAAGFSSVIHQLEISPDGFLVGIGNEFDPSVLRYRDGYFFKMDLAGNLIWINRVSDSREIHFESMHTFSSTQYLFYLTVYDLASPTWADPASIVVDAATGNVTSGTPRYNYTPIAFLDDHCAAVTNTASNRVYSTGRIYLNGAATNSMRIYLSKHDIAGNILSTTYLINTAAQSARLYGSDIIYNNDSIAISYFGDISAATANFSIGLIRCDTNGNIAWAKNYNIAGSTSEMSYRVLSHPGGYFITGYTLSGGNNFFIISVDNLGNILWSRSYGNPASTENLRANYTPHATIIGSNIYFTGQSNSTGTFNMVLASVDFSGNISCLTPTTLTVATLNNLTNRTVLAPTQVTFTTVYNHPIVAPIPQPINDICANTVLNLGPDSAICGSIVLNATLPGATSYLWSTGSTNPTLSVSTPGTYWATVMINCCEYYDTVIISADSLPVAAFSWVSANCTGSISFTNSSTNAATYLWSYGDNTTSVGVASSHAYANSGVYTVTLVATSGCGSDTVSMPVVVPNSLSVTALPPIITICPGEPTSLTANGGGGSGPITYNWNPGGSGSTISVSPVVASTFIVTVSDSVGCAASDTITVNMIPPVTLSASSNTIICIGQSATISATATNTGPYTWSTSGSTQSITVSPLVTTTYYVSVIDTCSGLTITDSVVVQVDQLPVTQFSFTGPDCFGNVSFTNTSTNFTSCVWNFGDLSGSALTNPSHQYSGNGNYVLTLISNNACGADTAYSNVNIPPPYNLTATPNAISICPGTPTTLTASVSGGFGSSTYVWNPGGSGASIIVSPTTPSTFIVTATDSLGCTSADTINVNIIPAVLLSVSSDTSVCVGQPVTITAAATNGGPYTWSAAPGNTASITVTPLITTTYFVSVTDTCSGLTLTDSIVVTVDQLPVTQFSIIGPDCFGNCTFTNGSSNFTSSLWDFGDLSGDTALSPSHQYVGGGNFNVMLVSANACGTDTAITPVNIPFPLNIIVNPSSAVVCTGDSTLLSASATGGTGTMSYVWNPNAIQGPSIMITPSSSGWYYVSVTDSMGCVDSDSVSVTISTPVTLSATGGNTICFGQSTTISANASNGGPYTWSNSLGSTSSISVTPSVTTTYYVSVFDSCSGLTITDSVTVFVMPPSTVAFSVDSLSGCVPLTVYFTDLSTTLQDQISGWTWDFGDGDSSNLQSPFHTYTTPGSYTVTLTVVTTSGCVTTLINGAVINVYPVPVAGFDWEQLGSIGDQPEVQFTDESVGATTWQWYFGDSTSSLVPSPFHNYTSVGGFTAMQVVGNNYGCYDTAYAQLDLEGEFTIYVPNTFTPGVGDHNNTFGGIGTGIAQYHLMVFDRWGMLIFESNSYYTQWDGTFRGNKVQQDTYVWMIDVVDFRGGEHHLMGHINVIR